jgi:hypothetical protein
VGWLGSIFLICVLTNLTSLLVMRPKLAVAGTALISVFFVLTTVGCGGSASKVAAPGSSTPANPLSGRPSSGQFKKFAACMKAHGVNNYGPTSRPGGRRPWAGMKNGQRSGAGTTRSPGLVPRTGTTGGQGQRPGTGIWGGQRSTLPPAQREAQQKALAACRSLLPSGGAGQLGGN